MALRVPLVAIIVHDYDEAIEYFTTKLDFDLVQDLYQGPGKRWVVIAPKPVSARGTGFLLSRAIDAVQARAVGNQCGGRVGFFLETTRFSHDYHEMKARGVEFLEEPRQEEYGLVVKFRDLYGNKWDLLEATS